NTLNLAFRRAQAAGSEGFVLQHSKNLQARVEEAQQKLGLVLKRLDTFQEQITALARAPVTERQARTYWKSLFPLPRKGEPESIPELVGSATAVAGGDGAALTDGVLPGPEESHGRAAKRRAQILEQLLENYHGPSNTLPGVRDTAWSAFNALTQWVDHQAPVRGKDRMAQADRRMQSIFFGQGDELKQRAFQSALQLVHTA